MEKVEIFTIVALKRVFAKHTTNLNSKSDFAEIRGPENFSKQKILFTADENSANY